MPNDIEWLTKELMAYLSVLVSPSPEILVKKIPLALRETKLNDITLELSQNNLHISAIKKDITNCILDNNTLSVYGLRNDYIKNAIDKIRKNDSGRILSTAIEEVIETFNKKILELNISSAILAYTTLSEKFKLESPNVDSSKIYNLIDEKIETLLTNEAKLTYNYFKRAYQGYKPKGFAYLADLETENLETIFNITKKLQINFTPYQTQYVTLINLIEELYIQNISATNLIAKLKHCTDTCFLSLLRIPDEQGKKIVKTTIENFKSETRNLINDYIKEHSDEYKKQDSILNKILEFIANMIPSFILSKDKKMTFFNKNYTECGIRIKNLKDQIGTMVRQNSIY